MPAAYSHWHAELAVTSGNDEQATGSGVVMDVLSHLWYAH